MTKQYFYSVRIGGNYVSGIYSTEYEDVKEALRALTDKIEQLHDGSACFIAFNNIS